MIFKSILSPWFHRKLKRKCYEKYKRYLPHLLLKDGALRFEKGGKSHVVCSKGFAG